MSFDFGLVNNGQTGTESVEILENTSAALGNVNVDFDTNNLTLSATGESVNYTVPAGYKLYITEMYYSMSSTNMWSFSYTLKIDGVTTFILAENRGVAFSLNNKNSFSCNFGTPIVATAGQVITTVTAKENSATQRSGLRGILRPII